MSEAGARGVALRRSAAGQVAASAKTLRWERGEASAATGGGQGERGRGRRGCIFIAPTLCWALGQMGP